MIHGQGECRLAASCEGMEIVQTRGPEEKLGVLPQQACTRGQNTRRDFPEMRSVRHVSKDDDAELQIGGSNRRVGEPAQSSAQPAFLPRQDEPVHAKQQRKTDGHFLEEKCDEKDRCRESVPRPASFRSFLRAKKQHEGQHVKKAAADVGNTGNPADRLDVQGVQRPKQRAREGGQVIPKKLAAQSVNQQHSEHVKNQLIEMECSRVRPCDLPDEPMGKDVQGPVEIRFRRRSQERPDRPGEDVPPQVWIAHEGIFQNLPAVVVDKPVGEHAAKDRDDR